MLRLGTLVAASCPGPAAHCPPPASGRRGLSLPGPDPSARPAAVAPGGSAAPPAHPARPSVRGLCGELRAARLRPPWPPPVVDANTELLGSRGSHRWSWPCGHGRATQVLARGHGASRACAPGAPSRLHSWATRRPRAAVAQWAPAAVPETARPPPRTAAEHVPGSALRPVTRLPLKLEPAARPPAPSGAAASPRGRAARTACGCYVLGRDGRRPASSVGRGRQAKDGGDDHLSRPPGLPRGVWPCAGLCVSAHIGPRGPEMNH